MGEQRSGDESFSEKLIVRIRQLRDGATQAQAASRSLTPTLVVLPNDIDGLLDSSVRCSFDGTLRLTGPDSCSVDLWKHIGDAIEYSDDPVPVSRFLQTSFSDSKFSAAQVLDESPASSVCSVVPPAPMSAKK